jgi:cell division septal protein FtsQ
MKPAKLPNKNSEVKVPLYRKLCRKKWFKILRPILIVGLVILIIYILTILGIFQIKKIETDNKLKHVANFSETTKKYLGKGYFSLGLEQMEEEIKNSNRYIKSVSAEKIFPNKIFLEIEEYEPMTYMEYKESCYIFSQEGLVLDENAEYEQCFLENGIKLETSQNILAEDRLIFDTEIYEIVKVLEEFGWDIKTISFDKNVLEISDGEKSVTIEVNQEYETQLSKLYLVLEKVNMEGLEYKSLDLRFERPVMELL